MLVTTKELVDKAQSQGYAVGAFNACNLEIAKAIIQAAKNLNAPVIIQTSESEARYGGIGYLSSIVKTAASENRIPFALHLDHGKSLEMISDCLVAGYTSIHIDGSELPYNENVNITRSVVKAAHKRGASTEGELGYIVGSSGFHKERAEEVTDEKFFTDPSEASDFVKATGIDMLAISIGNLHGIFEGKPKLDFRRLKKIKQKTKIPLVLHGASSTEDKDIKKAISLGICKVNTNTEVRIAYTNTLRYILSKNTKEIVPYRIFPPAGKAVQKVVEAKIKLFGSAGKA
jgi:ketose-bisphosphate aldolase